MTSGDTIRSLRSRYAAWTEPRLDGLPRLRVLAAFPLLLALAGVLLIGLSVNGTSSGVWHQELETGRDPDLLLGTPQPIRTDEWNVQTVWAIAQVEQGLPVVNESFPGGMDATIPQDLPRADWSVAFRPHLLGFLVFDVDHGQAWKWWLPALSLLAAAYCFVVTVIPRRPLLSAGLALAFYLSPLLHWWFLQTTLWPVAWGFVVLTAVLWSLRARTRVAPLVWAGLLAYLTVVMAMGIYVPFIVPVVLVAAFASLGAVIESTRSGMRFRELAARIWPVLAAGVVGSAVVALWLVEKRETVEAFLGTAYPGERLSPTGQGDLHELAALGSSSFAMSLRAGGWLGTNPSEASTFFLVGAFLAPAVVWMLMRRRRDGQRTPWMLIGAGVSLLVVIAFVFVPGWDAIAHALFLDRSTNTRLRIGLGFASFLIAVLLIPLLDRDRRPGRVLAAVCAAIFLLTQGLIAWYAESYDPGALGPARFWVPIALASAAVIYLFARAMPVPAVAGLLAIGLLTAATVNPWYRGVLDLRDTAISRAVQELDASEPDATWVGVGDRLTTAILLESGVQGFNGFQGAPSEAVWDLIDPDGEFEFQWDRLAGVSWTFGEGEPTVSNPAADQILVTFDPCSDFAQDHIDFVLADVTAASGMACLVEVEDFDIVDGELTVYEVVPAS